MLKDRTVAALSGDETWHDASFDSNPPHETLGCCTAYANLSSDESSYSIQRIRYKFALSSPLANSVLITYNIHSDVNPDVMHSVIIPAGSLESDEIILDEPDVAAGTPETLSFDNINCREV